MPFIKNLSIFARKISAIPTLKFVILSVYNHSLYINNSGRVWSWGLNSSGELGDGTTISKLTPVSVCGAVKTFCQISAGNTFSVAIDKNGRAWGWGGNGGGQLGDNTTVSKRTPVSVLGTVKTFCQITAANCSTFAIDKNGRAWAWGENNFGQLGDNSITPRLTPVSVAGTVKTFCQISSGNRFSVAIDKNGRAWGWGVNFYGEVGDNSATSKLTPVSVAGTVKTFCKISAGNTFSLAIDKNGRAWGWGFNGNGQLGDNSTLSKTTPVSVLGTVKTFCQIAGNIDSTVAIDKNGRAWAWGNNSFGELGDNTTVSKRTPVSVAGTVKTFCQIAAASRHVIAVDKNGGVWAWGSGAQGQLGDNTIEGPVRESKCSPVSVRGNVKTFCKIGADSAFSLGIDKNGRVWSWGDGFAGKLGDNSASSRATPVSVLGAVKTFCNISLGTNYAIALDKGGRAWAWGLGSVGQLGNNSTFSFRTPISVLGTVKTFCKIFAGDEHSIALDKNGRAWAWGNGFSGKLGNNTASDAYTPVSIAGATKTFCEIAAGTLHTLSIDKNGRAWGWGANTSGQLGDNSTLSKRTPVSVLGTVKTFCKIDAGSSHTIAIDKNGRVWTWGGNTVGQLGDNSITSKLTPVSVAGTVKTFCQISINDQHSLAIDKNGRVWAWGNNTFGQLGDNTTVSKRTPVSVAGTVKTFCQIVAGKSHSIVIDKNGQTWAWGANGSGELGDNKFTKLTPVRVCVL